MKVLVFLKQCTDYRHEKTNLKAFLVSLPKEIERMRDRKQTQLAELDYKSRPHNFK